MLLLALVKLVLPAMGFAAGGADVVTGPWFSNFMLTNFLEEKYSTFNFHLFRVSNHLFLSQSSFYARPLLSFSFELISSGSSALFPCKSISSSIFSLQVSGFSTDAADSFKKF